MKRALSAVVFASLFATTACNNSALKERDAAIQAQQHTIDSMNAEMAKKKTIDSMNELVKTQYIVNPPASVPVPVSPAPSYAHHSTVTRHSGYSGHRTTTTTQPVVYQEAPRKRGWSAKAKGAVIGAATGAAAGAIINGRNRGAGAVIGGILGAGAGTGVGAVVDKKNGR